MEKNKNVTDIKNIWIKKNGTIFRNDVRPFVEMDNLPPPDCTGFSQMHLYRPFWEKIFRIIDVETSRGCPYSCSECINVYLQKLYKNKCEYHREKSIDKAISDLRVIKEKYSPEMLRFADEYYFQAISKKIGEFVKRYKKKDRPAFYQFR